MVCFTLFPDQDIKTGITFSGFDIYRILIAYSGTRILNFFEFKVLTNCCVTQYDTNKINILEYGHSDKKLYLCRYHIDIVSCSTAVNKQF